LDSTLARVSNQELQRTCAVCSSEQARLNNDNTGSKIVKKSGVVGRWKLDEGGGATAHDCSGNAHHGSLRYASWEEIEDGHALSLDGINSRVVIACTEKLQITGDITICAWIYKFGANNWRRWDSILTKCPGKYDYELLTSKAESDQLAFYSPTCQPKEIYGSVPVRSHEWHHVALTRSGDRANFFLDGLITSEVEMIGDFPVSNGDLIIGHDGARGRGFGLRGMIRDVWLFSRALMAQEVMSVANGRA
jgi:hypothetical protein